MVIYDTFTKQLVEVNKTPAFLKSYGLHNHNNVKTFNEFRRRTIHSLNRFIKLEHKDKIFHVYCLDTNVEYECVSVNGFLLQIGVVSNPRIIVEFNKMRYCGMKRKTISIDGLLYCLSENKDILTNHSLCSRHYKDIDMYTTSKSTQRTHRRLANNLRSRLRAAVLYKSNSTLVLVGCSIEFLMGWLEKSFTEGMTWNNYGEWHIDHIIPCAAFDLTIEENQMKCFHYTNLQPLWAIDNIMKGSSQAITHNYQYRK